MCNVSLHSPVSNQAMKRMFLRNLPRGSTEDDIIATFGRYGRIDYVHMPPNVTTFANISFVSLEEVDACMAARPHQVSIGGSRWAEF